MTVPEHYDSDVLYFFDGNPDRLTVYQALYDMLDRAFPQTPVKVQKPRSAFTGGACSPWSPCPSGGRTPVLWSASAWGGGSRPRASLRRWSPTPTAGPTTWP